MTKLRHPTQRQSASRVTKRRVPASPPPLIVDPSDPFALFGRPGHTPAALTNTFNVNKTHRIAAAFRCNWCNRPIEPGDVCVADHQRHAAGHAVCHTQL